MRRDDVYILSQEANHSESKIYSCILISHLVIAGYNVYLWREASGRSL